MLCVLCDGSSKSIVLGLPRSVRSRRAGRVLIRPEGQVGRITEGQVGSSSKGTSGPTCHARSMGCPKARPFRSRITEDERS